METMRCFTRQRPEVLKELEENGRYVVKEEFIREKNMDISEYYLDLYRWYAKEGSKIVPIPEDANFPIWFFIDEAEKLPYIENTVIMEFDIPKDKLIITDVDQWGYRVNYMYVPKNNADRIAFEDELDKYGIVNETDLIRTSKGNFYPLLKRKILESWSSMFGNVNLDDKSKIWQATSWELKREWLVKALVSDK